jgi:iron complex outermembrane receptor protein
MDDRFELTLGVNNIFNTNPPRVSGVSNLGNAPLFASQYDWFGRRVFLNAKARF